jgi:hypothetical protein
MKATKFRTVGWLATAALVTAALVAPATASAALGDEGPDVTPTQGAGNFTECPEGQGATISLDFDDLDADTRMLSGTIDGVTVTITYDDDLKTTDFEAEGGVVWHAFIKGGNKYNHYNYTGLDGVTEDDGLVAPDNESGGPADLSHAVFCVVADEPDPSDEPTPTPTATPDGGVEDTTDPSLPPTSTLTGKSGTSDTWRTMLLVLAAVLATTLVLTPARSSRKR